MNCLCPPVRRTPCSSFGSRAVRSLDCAHSTSQGLRASSGRGRPAMRFGELAWLAHRGCCTQGCAQRERVRHQVAKSSRERQMAGYAREELSFAAHAACGNAERRHRGLHHTRAAAAVRCFAQERRALAIAHRSRKNHARWTMLGPGRRKAQIHSSLFEAKLTTFRSARH